MCTPPAEFITEAMNALTKVTQILQDWNGGDANAPERLMPFVYDELRRLARTFLIRESRRLGPAISCPANESCPQTILVMFAVTMSAPFADIFIARIFDKASATALRTITPSAQLSSEICFHSTEN